jgi:putative cardiolipin synthase
MHNKLFIADNQAALIGGRNIANAYFGASAAYNFRDFDLFSVGPVVRDISKSFDDFWNSSWAVPVGAMYSSKPSARDLEEAYGRLEHYIASHPEYPYGNSLGYSDSLDNVKQLCGELLWGRAEVASDSPGKSTGPDSQQITSMLREFLRNAKQEVLIVTPYLVPSNPEELKKKFTDLKSRGITVRILTNSLGSTDMLSAHVGYAKYRKLLVQCGVEMYEMRPDAASRTIYTAKTGPDSVMGLHGKAALVDRSCVFIGTFNFDQRSANINTEVGLLIYSPELARKVASAVAVDLQGKNSWRVSMASECDPNLQPGSAQELVWIADEQGGRACLDEEPSSSRRRLFRSILGLLPLESQL